MSESWTWRYEDAQGEPVSSESLPTTPFPSQAEAEAWLSDGWAELADAGVAQVTLKCDDEVVYGPMSLAAE